MIASLDTNVIVRLFIAENSRQTQAAVDCLEQYDRLEIADVAIIEAIYTLANWYDLGRSKAVELIGGLMSHPRVNCNRSLFTAVLPFYVAHPALSIEDCCLAAYAHLNNAKPLLTFDKKLANQSTHAKLLTT